eukprot:c9987_g2_i1.p2 GENE.c9987_g2_i1~~c9987_g2_i1.p2  ORF type:complete len:316 (+),score=74.31 c9987_g2_i1:1103-2050(+)
MGFHTIGILPEYYLNTQRQSSRIQHQPTDIPLLLEWKKSKRLFVTPAQDYDDSYTIKTAELMNGYICTNDRYNDHICKQPKEKVKSTRDFIRSRCVSFTFIGDTFVPNPDFIFRPLIAPPPPTIAPIPSRSPTPSQASHHPPAPRTTATITTTTAPSSSSAAFHTIPQHKPSSAPHQSTWGTPSQHPVVHSPYMPIASQLPFPVPPVTVPIYPFGTQTRWYTSPATPSAAVPPPQSANDFNFSSDRGTLSSTLPPTIPSLPTSPTVPSPPKRGGKRGRVHVMSSPPPSATPLFSATDVSPRKAKQRRTRRSSHTE